MDVQQLEPVRTKRADLLYEFGPYVVDVAKAVLLRDGEVVPLGLKAFEVLLVLIEQHGQVVRKDELLSQVWPDTVVEENNLARTISALRKSLGENLEAPQFITTIPGRGYRFVADVKERPIVRPILYHGLQPLTQETASLSPPEPVNGHAKTSSPLVAPVQAPVTEPVPAAPAKLPFQQYHKLFGALVLLAGISGLAFWLWPQ